MTSNHGDWTESPVEDESSPAEEDLAELLYRLLSMVVDTQEGILVTHLWRDGRLVFSVTAAPGEVGQVLGKRGRTIDAIRHLLQSCAGKQGVPVRIDVWQ